MVPVDSLGLRILLYYKRGIHFVIYTPIFTPKPLGQPSGFFVITVLPANLTAALPLHISTRKQAVSENNRNFFGK